AKVCQRFAKGLTTTNWSEYRSEEHTSELQSLTNLVCRLLLENKDSSMPSLIRRSFFPAPAMQCHGKTPSWPFSACVAAPMSCSEPPTPDFFFNYTASTETSPFSRPAPLPV